MSALWVWGLGPSVDMSARARFLEPLLWVLKRSGLDFEGRARPVVVLVGGWERRVERVLVKAREEGVVEVEVEALGRGAP